MKWIVIILVMPLYAVVGATWYVRPPVISGFDANGKPIPVAGTYGNQNGTSYANAWNGLREVVWGATGVQAGDTLYVCGAHVHRATTDNYLAAQALVTVGASGTSGSPITIRGDYSTDPGEVFGCFEDKRYGWSGPDANGVYNQSEQGPTTHVYGVYFESSGAPVAQGNNEVLLVKTNVATWMGRGYSSFITSGNNETNFYSTVTGAAITTNVFSPSLGYRFDMGSNSNIVFSGLWFFNSVLTGTKDYASGPNHITLTNCVMRFGSNIRPVTKWDDWAFYNCTMHDAQYGVYSLLNSQAEGAERIMVSGCTIYNMGLDGWFLDQDGHGIGIQGGSGHVFERNTIYSTGSAIEFWTYDQPMSNNVVRWNYIHDIAVRSVTSGNGVVVSGDNTFSIAGLRTGYAIYGNIIANCGIGATHDYNGCGISSNNKDSIDIYNNTIFGCTNGMRIIVVGDPVLANINNNVIYNIAFRALDIEGTGSPTLDCDHNLFFNGTNVVVSPSATHDSNSVFADPLFISASPSVATDFMLQATSPAIHAGTSVGPATDYRGILFANPPSIGAFEVGTGTATAVSATATHMSGL